MGSTIFDYLKNKKITSVNDLRDTLNLIGPYIDGWSVSHPLTKSILLSFCTKQKRKESYLTFKIPKKSGGFRTIVSPCDKLKNIQRSLLKYLERIFVPDQDATGFIPLRSIHDNAIKHIGKDCVVNLDLENFFPSINKQMLRKALNKEISEYIQSKDTINAICSLCTIPTNSNIEVLAQGAPTSPLLSNIVLKEFDREAANFCKKNEISYSRYADDITLSFNNGPLTTGIILNHFRSLIENFNFKLNEKKIKILKKGSRQEVTGIVTNVKLNLCKNYVKQLRVLLHLWEKRGYESAKTIYKTDFHNHKPGELKCVIKGKLNYLRMIKGEQDSTFIKLNKRYMRLIGRKRKENNFNPYKEREKESLILHCIS